MFDNLSESQQGMVKGGIIVALLLLAALIVYYVIKGRKSSSSSATSGQPQYIPTTEIYSYSSNNTEPPPPPPTSGGSQCPPGYHAVPVTLGLAQRLGGPPNPTAWRCVPDNPTSGGENPSFTLAQLINLGYVPQQFAQYEAQFPGAHTLDEWLAIARTVDPGFNGFGTNPFPRPVPVYGGPPVLPPRPLPLVPGFAAATPPDQFPPSPLPSQVWAPVASPLQYGGLVS